VDGNPLILYFRHDSTEFQSGRADFGKNTAENLHGGVCEGGEVSVAMVDLHAHEAGNGG
jgi:hypothetical protein